MKVVCVEKFIGYNIAAKEYHSRPNPVVGAIYEVIGMYRGTSGFLFYKLKGFGDDRGLVARKFRPITTEDFRWESIDEVLQNVTSEVQ